MAERLIGQGREDYNSSDTPPPPARGVPAFVGKECPLARAYIAIAKEAADRVGTDTAWALTCLANSVNVRRRETNQREIVS